MLEIRQKPIASVGVAWCPGGRTAQNAAVPAALAQGGHGGEPGAGGEVGGGGRVRAETGVGVDPAAAGGGDRVDAIEVPRGMDALEIGPRRRLRLERGERLRHAGALAPSITACSRAGRSGWPGPVRCSR